MPGGDKADKAGEKGGAGGADGAPARVIALIVLLFIAAAALRGYLPAAEHTPHRQDTESPVPLTLLAILLTVSLGIVAGALITRVRNRHAVPGSMGVLSVGSGAGKVRPRWRVVLIALAVMAAWLMTVWLASRWAGSHRPGRADRPPGTGVAAPPAGTVPGAGDRAPRPEPPQQDLTGEVLHYLTTTAAIMLAMIAAAVIVAARTRRRGPAPASAVDETFASAVPAARPESLVRAAELGLAEIGDPDREPREAIIACYATMERELAHVPEAVPQEFDTPTEVLARAVDHHALPADNAAQLVKLFAEARFSAHLMTEQHRAEAVRILQLVLAELRSAA